MLTRATVRNAIDESKFATVWLKVSGDPEGFKLTSLLSENSGHEVYSLGGQKYEKSTYMAWESACFSGVFYIRKRVSNDLLAVEVVRIAGCLERGDASGFAVAASAAFLREMGHPVKMSEKDLAGWKIESIECE
jgi:hypothetical protein